MATRPTQQFFVPPAGRPSQVVRKICLAFLPRLAIVTSLLVSAIATAQTPPIDSATAFTPDRIKELMRPSFSFVTDWQPQRNIDDVGIYSTAARISLPTYPVFGPPPPIVTPGFRYTRLDARSSLSLPGELYESQLNASWVRLINDRWTLRFMAGASFATDGDNRSSDAWRFNGGAFGIYRYNPQWAWTFGAIALGRNDLPVLPAIGVIHQPTDWLRFDLIMPRPRISFLLREYGPRQEWGYIGASLNGATWGVERDIANVDASPMDDQLTYGDVRVVVGWESTPTQVPGVPFTRGRKVGFEIGYAFSRDFEWESDESKISFDDALTLRVTAGF